MGSASARCSILEAGLLGPEATGLPNCPPIALLFLRWDAEKINYMSSGSGLPTRLRIHLSSRPFAPPVPRRCEFEVVFAFYDLLVQKMAKRWKVHCTEKLADGATEHCSVMQCSGTLWVKCKARSSREDDHSEWQQLDVRSNYL